MDCFSTLISDFEDSFLAEQAELADNIRVRVRSRSFLSASEREIV